MWAVGSLHARAEEAYYQRSAPFSGRAMDVAKHLVRCPDRACASIRSAGLAIFLGVGAIAIAMPVPVAAQEAPGGRATASRQAAPRATSARATAQRSDAAAARRARARRAARRARGQSEETPERLRAEARPVLTAVAPTATRPVPPPPTEAPAPPPPPLVIECINGGAVFELTPETDQGGFDETDLAIARTAFAHREGGREHDIHPRLLDLVYQTMRHFGATKVELISGYRAGRGRSRHFHGRAIDMRIPGVSNRDLAEHLRTLGFVGVGIYTRSGFVHLDVRSRSYFWVDRSLPNRPSRPRPHLRTLWDRMDAEARARGVEPTPE